MHPFGRLRQNVPAYANRICNPLNKSRIKCGFTNFIQVGELPALQDRFDVHQVPVAFLQRVCTAPHHRAVLQLLNQWQEKLGANVKPIRTPVRNAIGSSRYHRQKFKSTLLVCTLYLKRNRLPPRCVSLPAHFPPTWSPAFSRKFMLELTRIGRTHKARSIV